MNGRVSCARAPSSNCGSTVAERPSSPRLRPAAALHGHRARKRFGQNFLSDPAVIEALVRAIAPQPGQAMLEIGPGLGALTQPLVERLGALTVIELDRDLAQRLRAHPQLQVIEADVLRVDFTALAALAAPHRLRIVGNLPYNISSPILFHLLALAHLVQDQHFMLQQEVVERMVAAPCSADYGRLSVMLQWRYAMEQVLRVPPQSFTPPPRVHSAVVLMRPLAQPAALPLQTLENLVRVAFSQRRKLLRHSLGRWLDAQGYSGRFDLQRRAEEVPVPQYLELAQELGGAAAATAAVTAQRNLRPPTASNRR